MVVHFPNPDIVAIKATIQVKDYELVGCGDSDISSRVRARIVGSFFNAATPTQDSNENNVWAQIRLQRNAGSANPYGVLRVLGNIFRCTDSACNGTSPFSDSADLGTARVGQRVTLSLEWDQVGKRFIFQRIGGGEKGLKESRDNGAEVSLYYNVPDTQPPSVKFRRLEVSEALTNCGTTQPRPVGFFIDAYFDNVFVSQ